jgi:hypothetical protein
MPDFNFSNAGWLAIIAVVLASQVLVIWAIYLILKRSYRSEIADLQEQLSALNERLENKREPSSGGMLTLLTGLFLSILFLLAAVYFAWWLFRPTGVEPSEPAKIQIDPPAKVEPPPKQDPPKQEQQPARQQPNPETVRIRRQYPCCCPPDYYFGRNDDYYWRPGLGWTLRHGA